MPYVTITLLETRCWYSSIVYEHTPICPYRIPFVIFIISSTPRVVNKNRAVFGDGLFQSHYFILRHSANGIIEQVVVG